MAFSRGYFIFTNVKTSMSSIACRISTAAPSTLSTSHKANIETVKSDKLQQIDEKKQCDVTSSSSANDWSKFMTPAGMQYNMDNWLTNTDNAKDKWRKLMHPSVLLKMPIKTLQKQLNYLKTSEARSQVYRIISERLTRERLADNYASVAKRLTPAHQALSDVLSPLYQSLRTKVQQLHKRPLLQEIAKNYGPTLLNQLERIQLRLQQPKRSGGSTNHEDVLTKQHLLTVNHKCAPLLTRMISTLTQMIEQQNLRPTDTKQNFHSVDKQHQRCVVNDYADENCQCGGFPSDANKTHRNDSSRKLN